MASDIRLNRISRFRHYSDCIRLGKYYALKTYKFNSLQNLQEYYIPLPFVKLCFIYGSPENHNLNIQN